ncbi:gliding motility lipoprotein GldJ [Flammeovirga kamogawensis]|uniref:Gliding motility lipoprotein GldJ n=1 Tax=Flammeovirga kamogawensis TaxID=373891 RepID=A0ABX8GU06_9BACT|nr:gliding motility lipoprotein GldJ [Flammeovirga kamogawensis]MBB6460111.1 gliding motility-associated lipoprotein GldJ [Flammeovirga kamogawensis]QWG06846.1 gliding motility lipoprotein GldJ [Flammeovirga kamogawensis]TRX68669.1 gliding motility lipoprotein GldJ [Flammeovirga kamogawensis]
MSKRNLLKLASALLAALVVTGCAKSSKPTAENPGGYDTATGLEYNGKDDNSFAVREYNGMPEVPNMRYIEGGRFVLGSYEEDLMKSRDNLERTVSVASFWMDETEVSNINWLVYLHYVSTDSSVSGISYDEALPDTTVWAEQLAFNDQYVDHYLRYPGFRQHPVVGVTWTQAQNYCAWRTSVVNKNLAINDGTDEEAEAAENGEPIPLESGVVLPSFRLPTEAEWDYAAQALIGLQDIDENYSERRIYPWSGHSVRNPYGDHMGDMMANFKRGRGDYAGIGGKLNDGAMVTSSVYDNPPNDFGLYNMAGNVSEWVEDIYRPLSYADMDDLNPVRKNDYLDGPEQGYNYQSYGYVRQYESFISNSIRVYKGGSWKDVAYWMAAGTRRFLDQDSATATIGFRCAMINPGEN